MMPMDDQGPPPPNADAPPPPPLVSNLGREIESKKNKKIKK
jgi:hypothetical protein